MVELTLLERLKLIFNLVFSSPLFLILLFGFILMILDIFWISKKSKKTKVIYIIISIIVIGLLLHNYLSGFLSVLDTICKNIVNIIYFPSVLEFIVIFLTSLVILLVSCISKKTNKVIKLINVFVFFFEVLIFFLILDQLSINKIDLANKVSIYTNQNLMSLFECASIIFVVWVIGLILYKIIKKITTKEEIDNFYEEPNLPKTIEELRKEELIPPPQIEYIVVEKKSDSDMFTLEEYKEMRKLLEFMKENRDKKEPTE